MKINISPESIGINKTLGEARLRFLYSGILTLSIGATIAVATNQGVGLTLGVALIVAGIVLGTTYGFRYFEQSKNPYFSIALSDAKKHKRAIRSGIKRLAEFEKGQMEHVRAAKAALLRARQAQAEIESKLASNTRKIQYLADKKGNKVARCSGGITIYERWIDTPEISGSIVGVKAGAHDNTSTSRRITATRMLALGIFSLAVPKSRASGQAYCEFDGPEVAGVIVVSASKSYEAGPRAAKLAAQINTQAIRAAQWEQTRDQQISNLKADNRSLSSKKADEKYDSEYLRLLTAIDPAFRAKVKWVV